ncbi:unnamed protein product [Heterobilharzia americana]|nr:unnamed protein product [Heterobilharzia americana]
MKAAMKVVIPMQGSRQNITSYLNSTTENVDFNIVSSPTSTQLFISWLHPGQKQSWGLTFSFILYGTGHYSLDSIVFTYQMDNDELEFKTKTEIFSIPKDSYYNCSETSKVELLPEHRNYSTVRLLLDRLEVEAFRQSSSINYVGTEFRCSNDNDKSLTYFIVGFSLFTMAVIITFVLCLSNDESREVSVDPFGPRF